MYKNQVFKIVTSHIPNIPEEHKLNLIWFKAKDVLEDTVHTQISLQVQIIHTI